MEHSVRGGVWSIPIPTSTLLHPPIEWCVSGGDRGAVSEVEDGLWEPRALVLEIFAFGEPRTPCVGWTPEEWVSVDVRNLAHRGSIVVN